MGSIILLMLHFYLKFNSSCNLYYVTLTMYPGMIQNSFCNDLKPAAKKLFTMVDDNNRLTPLDMKVMKLAMHFLDESVMYKYDHN